jgi:alpha-beta hydrolase superfamily lysophospholipase
MKASAITLIILSLILHAGAADLGAGLKLGAKPAAPEASDDNNNEKEAFENESVRWHDKGPDTQLAGVALVIHGLNCRPDKMEAIIAKLNASGIDCLNVSLRGHGTNFTPIDHTESDIARMTTFKTVSYPLWKSEAYTAYGIAKKRSKRYGAPLFFIGFSMGGLLGVDLMTSNPNVKFDKMVLLAPAIAMLQRNYLIQVFTPFPSLVIPSAGNRNYLANEGTPMAGYNALFDMVAHFEDHLDPKKINIPTVAFIAEKDELVSYTGLQQMVQNQNLDKWRIHPVKKDTTATEVDMHHLIIDAASVGDGMWQEIVDVTLTHLLGGQP